MDQGGSSRSRPIDVAIRPASTFDIPTMRWVESDAGATFRAIGLDRIADDSPPSEEVLGEYVRGDRAWVACIDATVVGYATCSVLDGEGHVDQVSVARSAAGQRIGARLIERVDEWCALSGLDWLTLTTFRDVAWNAPYYSRLGFVVIPVGELGPGLAQVMEDERAAGLDVVERVAMRRAVRRPLAS